MDVVGSQITFYYNTQRSSFSDQLASRVATSTAVLVHYSGRRPFQYEPVSRQSRTNTASQSLSRATDCKEHNPLHRIVKCFALYRNSVMIPQYRPIYTLVHVHLVCGSILFPSSGGNSLVAKLSSGEPGVLGSSLMVSTSPLINSGESAQIEPVTHTAL